MSLRDELIEELKRQEADELTLKWVPIMLKTDEQIEKMLEYLVSIRNITVERQQVILKSNQIQNEYN